MAAADTRVDARDNERRDTDTEHHAGVHRQQYGEGNAARRGYPGDIRHESQSVGVRGELPQDDAAADGEPRGDRPATTRYQSANALPQPHMARRPRQRTDAACRRKHDAPGAYQHREECGGGWRAKHRHLRTPHRPVHAAAHQQRRHADSGGGGARGVRAVLHHEAHGVGHRPLAFATDDDGAGRQPRSRRPRTSRIPHHVRRNAVAKGIHMEEHQYSHRMHGNFLKRRVSHRLHGFSRIRRV